MKPSFRKLLSVILAGAWISISEFIRNQYLLRDQWLNHYEKVGLVFPSEPINGALWGLWSFLYALLIYWVSAKFRLIQTTLICWFFGFPLMWIVIGNLGVFPLGVVLPALPLSLFETFLAAYIVYKT